MVQEEIRKGPWTEQEDLQLICFVGLFGDRRWDFIAKVSGMKRTGKSCRLRWVNYLHPGLKRGKMTPHEEKLVLELHAQWGNRWSRIARRLPGRTDNEIKNYWRTHMRKKAQEGKQTASPSSSSNSSSLSSTNAAVNSKTSLGTSTSSLHSTRVPEPATQGQKYQKDKSADKEELYSIDDIWKDITAEDDPIKPVNDGYSEGSNFSCPSMSSPIWEYCPDNLWKLDEDESKIFFSTNDRFTACYENKNISPTS